MLQCSQFFLTTGTLCWVWVSYSGSQILMKFQTESMHIKIQIQELTFVISIKINGCQWEPTVNALRV
jgi:hypothetical protein